MTDTATKSQQDIEDEEKYGTIPEEGEVCVYGETHCKTEHTPTLLAHYTLMVSLAKSEPGVIHYSISQSTKDPNVFYFFEHYENKAAFEAHVARPESQKILGSEWVREFKGRFERPL